MDKKDFRTQSQESIKGWVDRNGFPSFRASQILNWLKKDIKDFEDMKNLPRDLLSKLKDDFTFLYMDIEKEYRSEIDETVKFLFKLGDGEYIESVVMKYKHGYSQCISTQVGCKMGCTFCATGLDGFVRNLTATEMIMQIELAQRHLGVKISSVVLMGMGEPLDNLDNVLDFFEMVSQSENVSVSSRKFTLSTCGLVDKIYQLAEHRLGITLSISLHAPNDEIRRATMPIARRWPIDEVIKASKYYADKTGRRVSFEYAMIDGVNDRDTDARELGKLIKGMLCHVNLIPLNPLGGAKEDSLRASRTDRVGKFSDILEGYGITVTVRRTLGADIDASCGQLRRRKLED